MSDVKKDHSNHACCHRRKCHRGHVIIPYDVTCVKLRAQINGMSSPARLVADTMFYCLQGSHQKVWRAFQSFDSECMLWLYEGTSPASVKRAASLQNHLLFLHEASFRCIQILERNHLHCFFIQVCANETSVSVYSVTDNLGRQTNSKIWAAAIQTAETGCSVFYTHWKQSRIPPSVLGIQSTISDTSTYASSAYF